MVSHISTAVAPAILPPVPRIRFPLNQTATYSDVECRNAFSLVMYDRLGWAIPIGDFNTTALRRAADEFKKRGEILKIPGTIFAHKRVIDMSLFLGIAIQAQ